MGLFQSVKSILKNVGIAAGTTAASITRTAVNKVGAELTARKGNTAPVPKNKTTKPPKPPTVAKATTPYSTTKSTNSSKMIHTTTTHKKRQPRQISPVATTHKKRVVRAGAPKISEVTENDEIKKLKAENAQLREWINKYKERETKPLEGDKYEQRGFNDVSKLNLNKAGLTVDSTTGGIVDSNGKLIAQYAGYTPEEISRFFREHPELADSENSPELRDAFEHFFAYIPLDAVEGVDYEQVTGSFF